MKVLMVDVGGTNVKLMASGQEGFRKIPSGPEMTAAKMVRGVLSATADWEYDAISVGFPGFVREGRIARNPPNLGGGWVPFDLDKAFKKPVRIINDSAMQALARYETGRMLFVGLGTSIGGALIADDTLIPLELGIMRLSKSEGFMDRMSKEALNKFGKARWQKSVTRGLDVLRAVFWPDHIALGGGNARHVDPLPEDCERGDNQDAFRGALRLWPGADMLAEPVVSTWRIKRKPNGNSAK